MINQCVLDRIVNASNFLSAARPIRLDKSALRRESKRLAKELAAKLKKYNDGIDTPLGDKLRPNKLLPLGYLDFGNTTSVKGERLMPVKVLVNPTVEEDSPFFILGAGVGKNQEGEQVIVIGLNAKYSAKTYADIASGLDKNVYDVLIHEVTHIADVLGRKKVKNKNKDRLIPTGQDVDIRRYYNLPEEVRAYMQEIVEQVLHKAPYFKKTFGGSKAVTYGLKMSSTWREIQDYLTPKNRNLIMKAVYTALQDEGIIP